MWGGFVLVLDEPRLALPRSQRGSSYHYSLRGYARLDEHCDIQSWGVDDSSAELQTRLVLVGGAFYAARAVVGACSP